MIDTAVIESWFRFQAKAPSKKEILDTFRSDDVLKHILECEGEVRCYEKVKTVLKCSSH